MKRESSRVLNEITVIVIRSGSELPETKLPAGESLNRTVQLARQLKLVDERDFQGKNVRVTVNEKKYPPQVILRAGDYLRIFV